MEKSQLNSERTFIKQIFIKLYTLHCALGSGIKQRQTWPYPQSLYLDRETLKLLYKVIDLFWRKSKSILGIRLYSRDRLGKSGKQ